MDATTASTTGLEQGLRCSACAGASVRLLHLRTVLWDDERLVVVDGVPTLQCPDCGERFLDDATAMRIDLLRGSGFPARRERSRIEVPVFDFDELSRPQAP